MFDVVDESQCGMAAHSPAAPPYSNLFCSWRLSVSVLLNLLTSWLLLLLRKICRACWFHLLLSGKQDWKLQIKRFEEMLIKKQWRKGNHNSTFLKKKFGEIVLLIWWARVMCLVQIFPAYKTVDSTHCLFCVLLIVLYAWQCPGRSSCLHCNNLLKIIKWYLYT